MAGETQQADPTFTWFHWVGIWKAPVRTPLRQVCGSLGSIFIDKGRCEHCGLVIVRGNPHIPGSTRVVRVHCNHGRCPCTTALTCPNGLSRACWYRSCPNRTSFVQAQTCGTFYSAFSNFLRTSAVKVLCPIGLCQNGHNCNDDCEIGYKAILWNYPQDQIYGPVPSGSCSNPQGHYYPDECTWPEGGTIPPGVQDRPCL
jgi:hypothetical protein